MAHASTSELFACSPEQFYEIVSDYERYPDFLSEIQACRVVEEQEGRKLVEYKLNVIKTFTYRLWMAESPPTEIRWEYETGDMFKSNTGYWKLEDEAGKCRAVYTLDCSFKMFVPGPIAKTLVQVNLPNMMSSYHQRVSALYG